MKISKSDWAIRSHNQKFHPIPKKVAATAKERLTKFRAAKAKKRDDALKKKHVWMVIEELIEKASAIAEEKRARWEAWLRSGGNSA